MSDFQIIQVSFGQNFSLPNSQEVYRAKKAFLMKCIFFLEIRFMIKLSIPLKRLQPGI